MRGGAAFVKTMRLIVLLLACLALAAPALAGPGRPTARLTLCDTDAHSVTFTGDMRRLSRATTLLQMRFTLQVRDRAARRWVHVEAPTFDTWLSSAIGKRRYLYDKNLAIPPSGGVYRSVVRFRWRSGDGKIVAHAQRVTPACRVPDDRPSLKPVSGRMRPGSSPQTREYVVRVTNRGDGDASAFAVRLQVDGVDQPDQTLEALIAGAADTVSFEAPRCAPGSELIATVDSTGLVDEANETDNTLRVPCPAS